MIEKVLFGSSQSDTQNNDQLQQSDSTLEESKISADS
jgi:hypothetical protein